MKYLILFGLFFCGLTAYAAPTNERNIPVNHIDLVEGGSVRGVNATDGLPLDELLTYPSLDNIILMGNSVNTNGVGVLNSKYFKAQMASGTAYLDLAGADASNNVILSSPNAATTKLMVGGLEGTPAVTINNGGNVFVNKAMRFGQNNSTIFGGDIDIISSQSDGQDGTAGIGLASYRNTDIWGSFLYGVRYRGTYAAPLAVEEGDVLMEYGSLGWDGTNALGGGELMWVVDDAVSTGVIPSRAELYVTNRSGSTTKGMMIDSDLKTTLYGDLDTTLGAGVVTSNASGVLSATTPGNITTSTSGVTITNGTGATVGSATTIDIATASTSTTGLLTSTNFNQFNNKPSGGGGLYGLAYWSSTSNLSALTELKITTTNPKRITMGGTGTPATLSNVKINSYDTVNGFLQNNIQNLSTGASASSDWVATADNGTDTTNFVDMGINGSGFSDAGWTISGALDAYLYSQSSNLSLGTGSAKDIIFHTGGTLAANERMRIGSTGDVTIPGTLKVTANNKIQLGTLDAYARSQIWNYNSDSVLRLGSLSSDGDAPGDISSEGIVLYGANVQGDTMHSIDGDANFSFARIKPTRFGIYNSSTTDGADYIFKVDTTSLYLATNTFTKTFEVNRASGKLTTIGGVVLNTSAAQPTCDSSIRGMLWLVQGGTGVADTLQVCMKDSSDVYGWVVK